MLATYATHILNWQRETSQNHIGDVVLNEIVFAGHAKTLASVRLNLDITRGSNEGDGESCVENLVAAIILLACFAHLCLNTDVWRLHMAAIVRIFEIKEFSLNLRLIALVEW